MIVNLNPNPAFQFANVTFKATGFACNDILGGNFVPPLGPGGSSILAGKTDSSGTANLSFNVGLSAPSLYSILLSGSRGGRASATFAVV